MLIKKLSEYFLSLDDHLEIGGSFRNDVDLLDIIYKNNERMDRRYVMHLDMKRSQIIVGIPRFGGSYIVDMKDPNAIETATKHLRECIKQLEHYFDTHPQ